MRIEIENIIDAENKEVYGFNLLDLNAVFVTYHEEQKLKGKRKWTITTFWDKYSPQSKCDEPDLPMSIRIEALAQVKRHIKVLTWKEFKNN